MANHEHQFQPAGVEFEEQQTVHFADLFVPSLSYFGLIRDTGKSICAIRRS